MNIGLIVDPYGEKSPGGLGRAIFEIARAIIVAGTHEDSFVVYVKKETTTPPPFSGTHWKLVPLGVKYLWLSAGRHLAKNLDAYIFFTPIIPLFFFPKKSIVIVHDFAYLETSAHSLKQKITSWILYSLHYLSLYKATAVVAVSEAAKRSTIEHFKIKEQKIRVIYNGFISFEGTPQSIQTPDHFFLFAGVLKARKNVLGVIRAFAHMQPAHPDYKLLIAGKTGGSYFEEAQSLVVELGMEEHVQFLGYVTDAQLAYLYSKAVALVFPSFIEGFGMPVLEAMHFGVPVITSHKGALAEVAGDAALLVDPHDPADIGRALALIADNPALRNTYIARGKARVKEFSWEKGGREFYDILARHIK